MSRFYFGGSDSSGSDVDEDSLPYPKPLARSAFLTPEFDPTTFLSSLHNRHQTLEDLRSELRDRSQQLQKELLDLVNDNYQDFLSLGSSLKGGEEKIEEVRVGLLGFKRDVEGLKGKVESRRLEAQGLIDERRKIRKDVQLGRSLLEVDQRLEELEERLMVNSNGAISPAQVDEERFDFSESDDESEEEEMPSAISTPKLRRRVQQYMNVVIMMERVGVEHPFISKQEDRVLKIRQTILLDLSSALSQSRGASDRDKDRRLQVLGLYREMGETAEAVKLLQEKV